jgi:chemotaxis protein MotB
LSLALLLYAGLAGQALAQQDPAAQAPDSADYDSADYDEITKLLDSIQTRVDEMNASTKDADAAMAFLSDQVEAAIRKLSTRETENTSLRETATGLTQELKTVALTRDALGQQVTRLTEEKDALLERLENQVRELASLLSLEHEVTGNLRKSLDARASELRASLDERDRTSAELSAVRGALAEQRAESEAQLRRTAALERDAAEARRTRETLESRLATQSAAIETTQASLDDVRARNRALDDELAAADAGAAALESRLADETAARQTTQVSLEESLVRNRAIDGELIAAGARMEALTRQLAALRAQIAELSGLLDASEGDNQEQQEVIADLGRRLNLALATKVRELAKYRSEFFGRLREVLGERSDVRIVGDRFVFQSEVLFHTGEAELEEPGREQLRRLAESLQQIADTIPSDIDWVLRIDGHTDERPIQTPRFPSNWELSTARAISVVRFLIEQGVPANRVMAAGFAHFRPLVPGRDEAAFQRNRRIEFRLTQK